MRAFFRARWDIFLYSAAMAAALASWCRPWERALILWLEVTALYVTVGWLTFKQRNSTKRHVVQDEDL